MTITDLNDPILSFKKQMASQFSSILDRLNQCNSTKNENNILFFNEIRQKILYYVLCI